MKRLITFAAFMLSMLLAGSGAFAQNLGWPRTIEQPAGKLVLFQPHVDSWDSELVWRQAFQLTPAGGAMTVGAASFQGTSSTNTETQIITVSGTQVTSTFFPGARCVRIVPAGGAVALADAPDAGSLAPAPRRLHAYARQHETATQQRLPRRSSS